MADLAASEKAPDKNYMLGMRAFTISAEVMK